MLKEWNLSYYYIQHMLFIKILFYTQRLYSFVILRCIDDIFEFYFGKKDLSLKRLYMFWVLSFDLLNIYFYFTFIIDATFINTNEKNNNLFQLKNLLARVSGTALQLKKCGCRSFLLRIVSVSLMGCTILLTQLLARWIGRVCLSCLPAQNEKIETFFLSFRGFLGVQVRRLESHAPRQINSLPFIRGTCLVSRTKVNDPNAGQMDLVITDGAVQVDQETLVAGRVLRHENGEWIMGYNKWLGKCSVFDAEL